ncbi:MAG: PBP1A family penicillin-binding protein [Candidatus Sungbacteria bacterium]|uniref:PBP1A family penicillin-binding protein n=1 Tax=Candidatus Sungiibacteriota bacterium TaxID=2750080 RepID=A0A931WNH6_9BACT|nr:PBP1A family penicillin-binding protein [Candidatus Sungbacteria bacterium]
MKRSGMHLQRSRIRRRVFFFVLWLAIAAAGIFGVFLFFVLQDLPDPTRLTEQNVSQSTKIYDRTGTVVLYDVHGDERRTVVPFDRFPERLRQATVAIEDADFYNHRGLDFRGILRALYVDLVSGNIRQGGSTITQQLVTNSLLTRGRSLREKVLRKIREIVLAIIIDSRLSKDEILALYLNQIPYGSQAYGAEAAAETYFGKSVENLTLPESALLAGIPRAPSYYSPYGPHLDELLQRKDLVLDRMAKLGYITPEEAAKTQKEPLALKRLKQNILAPGFVFYIRDYLRQTYGEEYVERGGLKVITTLDWKLQQTAEEVVRNGVERNSKLIQAENAALVAMDPKTGEVLAMVGSKNYFADPVPASCAPGVNCRFDPQVNVTLRRRQPGSAFKPFVYATALAKGYTPDTILFDVPTEFNSSCNPDGTAPAGVDPRSCYSPGNYDEKFRGPVTVRSALAQSLNVPSVELLYLAGVDDSIQTAGRLGITSIKPDPSRYGLALVLGGAEVTLLDMVHAYGAFAREGVQAPKTSVLRVEDADGNVLEEKKEVSGQVLDPEIARTINGILSDNDARQPVFAPRSSLYFPDRAVAAKTGTTQDYRDAWTIGYTPSLVAGVWVGNNDNSPIQQKGSGVLAAAPIWRAFMDAALEHTPPEQFTRPLPIEADKPILKGLWEGGRAVEIDRVSGKLATPETPDEFRQMIAAGEPHTILYWINRNNPRGPVPENPGDDPQFRNWETALQKWLETHPVGPQPVIPTEYDTIHTEANRPKLFVSAPAPGDVVQDGKVLVVRLSFESVFRAKEIDFIWNDEIKRTVLFPQSPLEISLPVSNGAAGDAVLKVRAADEFGNKSETAIPIVVTP